MESKRLGGALRENKGPKGREEKNKKDKKRRKKRKKRSRSDWQRCPHRVTRKPLPG